MISVNLWTLGIQLVVFLTLVVLLNYLLFQPVLRVLERRDKVLRDNHALGENATRLAEEKGKAYDARILSSRQEALALRAEARGQATGALRALVQKTREENLAEIEKARKTLAGDAQQARAAMKAQVDSLAGELASALLGRSAGGRP